jgi:glutamine amidotransferase
MIIIIDYDAGNLTSVERAVRHLGYEVEITRDHEKIRRADRLIFPGVGAAGSSMEVLHREGLSDLVKEQVLEQRKPFLAICIGIQIIFENSEEDNTQCLGLLPGTVKLFRETEWEGETLKVPQIGWNQLIQVQDHPIFNGVQDDAEVYFVNSYYCEPKDRSTIIGESEYGVRFACAVAKDNLVATQFHLEKSGPIGLRMLNNFCEWRPKI